MSDSDSSPSSSEPGQYEFNDRQNAVIQSLASAMRWVAMPMLVLGILYIFPGVMHLAAAVRDARQLLAGLLLLLVAALYFTLGIWMGRAADSFSLVVSTSRNDITHLMEALDNLRKTYSVLSLFVKIYVAIVIIAFVLGLIAFVGGWLPAASGSSSMI